ncbi:MAG TPA: apolipoprotein N-acyltransferase [Burkholderiaceae bacterium]|nr:apolipoprotein N-acyltransferase [Burkholderiaceae bacterium]HNG77843.1 apolipoprotein N-acyltransferase [Burkholderiaceae bacterium]
MLPVALVAGGLQAVALAPWPQGGVQVLALALLVALLRGRPPRAAALIGLAFGFAWMLGTFFWLFVSMHRYGHLPAPLAAAAVVALAAAMALYPAAAAAAFAAWAPAGRGRAIALWGCLWLACELARAQWLTGFPWGAVGYAHVDSALALLAPWLGVYGLGAVAAMLAAGSALQALEGRGRWRFAAAVPALALTLLPAWRGPDFTEPSTRLSVTLLQGNVPQDEKFDFERLPATLAWHVQTIAGAKSDLVVAPETAIPLLPAQLPDGLWAQLSEHFTRPVAQGGGPSALIGVPLGDFDSGYTNSVAGLGPGQDAYRYDKHHLVPFGEFVPPGFRWFIERMRIPLGDFSRGDLAQPSFAVGRERVAPNICYEDLFGEELAARWNGRHAAPTLLANVSNIGWFGDTVAVDQHLQISRMRSLELQRPMLRATNTGATAIIDHRARVTHQLPPHQRGVLVGEVTGREGATPFARWAAHGQLWPLWLLALGGSLALVRWRPRAQHGAVRPGSSDQR